MNHVHNPSADLTSCQDCGSPSTGGAWFYERCPSADLGGSGLGDLSIAELLARLDRPGPHSAVRDELVRRGL